MKIRHSDKQWVGKILVIISIILILCLIVCIVRLILPSKSESINTEVQGDENTLSYVTMQVVDYESNSTPIVWEIRYDIWNSVSYLYKNGKKKKEVADGGVEKIVDFEPEKLSGKYNLKEQIENKNGTGIVYEFDMETSEKYISTLLNSGYSLQRKILTPTYAEIYLLDTVGNTLRVLVFSENMLMAELYEDATMPKIESYFK